jgi:hypothetical protein
MIENSKTKRMCLEKAAFLSRDEANRHRHAAKKRTGERLSVYRCPNCSCFHLTKSKCL